MISKAEESRIRAEIIVTLQAASTFAAQDIFNRYPPMTHGDERSIKILLWEAIESVRNTDGIVFTKMPRFVGHYRRANWVEIEAHAKRQRAAGTRKHLRAAAKLRCASGLAEDAKDKERINDTADRLVVRVAMRQSKLPKTG